MKANSPQTLKGFRDFLPQEKRVRVAVARKFIDAFELFGFAPLETPTLEYASLLLGKYGDEADKLVYTFSDRGEREVGLRYDQTVPTARVLTQYQNDLPKFFRRYQIQNVFRADKPQKGRFREFTQCDIDIFGAPAPIADAEIIACTYQAFKDIGFNQVVLKINDRQLLISALQPFATDQVDVYSLIQSIDKLDKLPPDAVQRELESKGISGKNAQSALEAITRQEPTPELEAIINAGESLGVPQSALQFSPTLARGLDYYTGMIFEVWLPEYEGGSCGGGGRYDNLIEQLGGPNVPAVGIGIGFDRVVEAATQLGLVQTTDSQATALVTVFNQATLTRSLELANQLRQAGIATEIYPSMDKIGKQLSYASQQNIPFVIIVGEDEVANNTVTIKNMKSGEQQTVAINQAIELISAEG